MEPNQLPDPLPFVRLFEEKRDEYFQFLKYNAEMSRPELVTKLDTAVTDVLKIGSPHCPYGWSVVKFHLTQYLNYSIQVVEAIDSLVYPESIPYVQKQSKKLGVLEALIPYPVALMPEDFN